MTAFLGGGFSEAVLRQAPAASGGKKKPGQQRELADMTTQEAAAWLLKQRKEKSAPAVAAPQRRHRTGKMRAYQQLLLEEQQQQHHQQETNKPAKGSQAQTTRDSFTSEDETPVRLPAARAKRAPVVVGKRRRAPDSSDESDEDSDEEKVAPTARPRKDRSDSGNSSSSSDDDDSVTDRRRQRLLKLKEQQQAKDMAKPAIDEEIIKPDNPVTENSASQKMDIAGKRELIPTKPAEAESSSSEDDANRGGKVANKKPEEDTESSSSGSSDDDDSSNEEESEEEQTPVVARPVFVPKHKRRTAQEADPVEDEMQDQKRKEREDRRKQASRALVQQVVMETQSTAATETTPEGFTGAQNPRPDDTDDPDGEMASRDAWEVRELVRLLDEWDREQTRIREEQELRRRRAMTDEERLQEDKAAGRYQRPGEKKETDGQLPNQRYYHKGAFYMDEEEWDASDIRHKADKYAQTATGDDRINQAAHPSTMRGKKSGLANKSKFKGL